jgi:hypothetical protein
MRGQEQDKAQPIVVGAVAVAQMQEPVAVYAVVRVWRGGGSVPARGGGRCVEAWGMCVLQSQAVVCLSPWYP